MYLRIKNNVMCEFIPEIDLSFPNIPIESRYDADFLSECISMDDISGLHTGMIYDPDTQSFSEPPEPEYAPEPIPEPEPKPEPTPSELEILRSENKLLKAQIQAQTDRSDFIEDCIAEMAMQIYNE